MRAICCAAIAAVLLLPAGTGRAAPASSPASCCGPITADGRRLAAALDGSGVERLWQAHRHIDWLTGAPDPARPDYAPHATHCSAFAAAMAERLGIYLLRPPQHGQNLLANAQARWLRSAGQAVGWQQVDLHAAQALANQGWFVVASYRNPDPHRPGHIAVLRPSLKSETSLEEDGPEETQAGWRNHRRTAVVRGFSSHPDAWQFNGAGTIRFYAHPVDWNAVR